MQDIELGVLGEFAEAQALGHVDRLREYELLDGCRVINPRAEAERKAGAEYRARKREAQRQYQASERGRAVRSLWLDSSREQRNESQRQWRLRNLDKAREYKRLYMARRRAANAVG